VDARSETVDDIKLGEAQFDFEATFRVHYERIARVIAKVVRDPARAEELAVEVLLKLWRSPRAHGKKVPTPEEVHSANEEQERVRRVLATMASGQAELLLLHGQDLTYDEVAAALELNPVSIGTLLSRARQAFRKEYLKRYGQA
jgi:RNA polymerase sigma-70 factor, ECF subfamily